jgi:hypothetical protein
MIRCERKSVSLLHISLLELAGAADTVYLCEVASKSL